MTIQSRLEELRNQREAYWDAMQHRRLTDEEAQNLQKINQEIHELEQELSEMKRTAQDRSWQVDHKHVAPDDL